MKIVSLMAENQAPLGDLTVKSRLPLPLVRRKRKLLEDADSIGPVENTKRSRSEKPDVQVIESASGLEARGVAVTKAIHHLSDKSASSAVRKPTATVQPARSRAMSVRNGIGTSRSVFAGTVNSRHPPSSRPPLRGVKGSVTPETSTSGHFGASDGRKPGSSACSLVVSSTRTTHKSARGNQRPGWDLRGQIEDKNKVLIEYRNQIAFLENQKSHLERDVQEKSTVSSTRGKELEKLRQAFNEADNERISQRNELLRLQRYEVECCELQRSVAELSTAKSSLSIQLDCSQVHLQQKTDECLKYSLNIKQLEELVENLKNENAEKAEQIQSQEMERRRLHNIVQELKGNIRVFCRVRPVLKNEENSLEHIVLSENSITLEKTAESRTGRDKKEATRFSFTFDKVFSPLAKQSVVFEEISHLVQSALDGYNVTIFAYGQTGGGKTYTMEGPTKGPTARKLESRGMIPRAVSQVFLTAEELQVKGWKYSFVASFLEIYNDTIQDLLVSGASRHDYEIKHKPKTSRSSELYVTNLKYESVTSSEEVEMLLHKASENRSVAATAVNDRSSRSHSIFQLHIEGSNECTGQACFAILTLVDLAGSERLNKSQSCGERLKEAQAINLSLSCLAQVITALGHKDQHVPFRNSKLTYLLQNCLSGNSKTLMFVNLSPSYDNFNETLNSLRFAAKVNDCFIGTAQANKK
uniref:Kinesin family member C1 n=2 Tax=Eptatretus burgeri TaxID=7764 RepID=A0A8C4N9K9_EPTBU